MREEKTRENVENGRDNDNTRDRGTRNWRILYVSMYIYIVFSLFCGDVERDLFS